MVTWSCSVIIVSVCLSILPNEVPHMTNGQITDHPLYVLFSRQFAFILTLMYDYFLAINLKFSRFFHILWKREAPNADKWTKTKTKNLTLPIIFHRIGQIVQDKNIFIGLINLYFNQKTINQSLPVLLPPFTSSKNV